MHDICMQWGNCMMSWFGSKGQYYLALVGINFEKQLRGIICQMGCS